MNNVQPLTVCFIGDSLISFYNWQLRFPEFNILNLGMAGETVGELLLRLHSIKIRPEPDAIFIMSGTNNLVSEDFSFFGDYEQLIQLIRKALPNSTIFINGLFPVKLNWIGDETIQRVNNLLAQLADRQKIGYLDGQLIFPENNPQPYFLADGVHLTDYGYNVWAETIEGELVSLQK